jgi:hypothetical protein
MIFNEFLKSRGFSNTKQICLHNLNAMGFVLTVETLKLGPLKYIVCVYICNIYIYIYIYIYI